MSWEKKEKRNATGFQSLDLLLESEMSALCASDSGI